ncbi:MAG: hypothetical protein NC405_08675 [Odoribacter sp.]|nr:hypothetical protein [Odoribacter sp.]
MATFTGKPVIVDKPAAQVAEKFSDLSRMQEIMDRMPDEQRKQIGDVTLTKDRITITTQQVGEINFTVTERTDNRVVFTAQGAPVPLSLVINLKELSSESTELTTSMEVEIPAFLKPMIGGAMQKAVDQFGQLMQKLA